MYSLNQAKSFYAGLVHLAGFLPVPEFNSDASNDTTELKIRFESSNREGDFDEIDIKNYVFFFNFKEISISSMGLIVSDCSEEYLVYNFETFTEEILHQVIVRKIQEVKEKYEA